MVAKVNSGSNYDLSAVFFSTWVSQPKHQRHRKEPKKKTQEEKRVKMRRRPSNAIPSAMQKFYRNNAG
jgi:hypothetical protein